MNVVFEVGAIDALGRYLDSLGARRVLVVSTPSRRFVDRAIAAMPRMAVSVCDRARVHVPAETVAEALAIADAAGADAVVTLGGGSAVGLGKALCLERQLTLAAVVTTYSGSEMTNVYGIRQGERKQTGRDDRVRPSLVLYDASLTTELPVGLTVQSLANSLAQIVSALSTDSIPPAEDPLPTVESLWRSMRELSEHPGDVELREEALRASSRAGRAIDIGTLGLHHALAHAIGGRFDLPHSAVHSVVLPFFMAHLRRQRPELIAALDRAAGQEGLEGALYDMLRAVEAPVSLSELGVATQELEALLEEHPELPEAIAREAQRGVRP